MRNFSVIPLILAATLACGKDAPTYNGPPIALIVLTAPNGNVPVGQNLQFSTVVRDVNGDVVTDAPLQWLSSATSVATVTQNGLVTGRAAGTARISARYGTIKDSLEISVSSNTFDVNTSGEDFLPTVLTVPVGATVRFNIFGDIHNVLFDHSVPGAPQDIQQTINVIVPRTFNTRGTFPYDCTLHPGMSGEIVVQ